MSNFNLMGLPLELLEAIILHLEPREAIYLSLTCRGLYQGILSGRNSRLWYLIGNFASGALPGHNPRWPISMVWLADAKPTQVSGRQVILDRFLGIDEHRPPEPVYMTKQELVNAARRFPVEPGEPVVDYRRLLVDTMLGLTETGCQWCLKQPETKREYLFPVLKGRLCEDCFRFNAIPIQYLELIPFDVEIPQYRVLSCPRYNNFFDRNGGSVELVWKPYVNRVIRENYCHLHGLRVQLSNVEDNKGGRLKNGKKMMKTKVLSYAGGWCRPAA